MYDPFDSSFYRMVRQIQRDEEMLRGASPHLSLLERGRIERETAARTFPHYAAFRSITDTFATSGIEALLDQIKRGGWARNTTFGFDRSLARVLADRQMLESAVDRGFISPFHMIESINRAHAVATERYLSSDLLVGLSSMQEQAAFAVGMRARIEESITDRDLSPGLDRLLDRLTSLTDVAGGIWSRYSDRPERLVSTPDFLREAPTHVVAGATRSTGLIITGDEGFAAEDGGLLQAQAGEIEERLAKINPALVSPYRGALDAFGRRENDYIRQIAVSLRELFVYLLREIAPDSAIEAWDPDVLPETGKVTNKARLSYVFRASAGSKAYATMTKKDIDHVLQNFFLLEGEGVHRLTSDLEHEEVRLLITRCEYGLLVVLRAHEFSVAAESH